MKDLAGVQDVFCGTETVLYMKPGSDAPSAQTLEEAFAEFEVAFDGVVRDDSRLL